MKRLTADHADLHIEAQRNRLLAANKAQADHIVALEATLREVHAILADKSSGYTDERRIRLAKGHVVGALARHGIVTAAARRT